MLCMNYTYMMRTECCQKRKKWPVLLLVTTHNILACFYLFPKLQYQKLFIQLFLVKQVKIYINADHHLRSFTMQYETWSTHFIWGRLCTANVMSFILSNNTEYFGMSFSIFQRYDACRFDSIDWITEQELPRTLASQRLYMNASRIMIIHSGVEQ